MSGDPGMPGKDGEPGLHGQPGDLCDHMQKTYISTVSTSYLFTLLIWFESYLDKFLLHSPRIELSKKYESFNFTDMS